MSATLQEQKFQQYFNNCPIVYVSGRMFPVKVYYQKEISTLINIRRTNPNDNEAIMEPKFDPQFISNLLTYIVTHYPKRGEVSSTSSLPHSNSRGEAILIFLSGIQQIEQLNKMLRQNKQLKSNNIKVRVAIVVLLFQFHTIALLIFI